MVITLFTFIARQSPNVKRNNGERTKFLYHFAAAQGKHYKNYSKTVDGETYV